MVRKNPKAVGWIVENDGVTMGLCIPGNFKGRTMPRGVSKVLLFSSRPTMFPDRKSAQRAIDNTVAYRALNEVEHMGNFRIKTLYEP